MCGSMLHPCVCLGTHGGVFLSCSAMHGYPSDGDTQQTPLQAGPCLSTGVLSECHCSTSVCRAAGACTPPPPTHPPKHMPPTVRGQAMQTISCPKPEQTRTLGSTDRHTYSAPEHPTPAPPPPPHLPRTDGSGFPVCPQGRRQRVFKGEKGSG